MADQFVCEEIVRAKPKRAGRRGQRQRATARLNKLRVDYRAGTYVVGSHNREARCEGCEAIFPLWRTHKMRFCSRLCAGVDVKPAAVVKETRRQAKIRENERRRLRNGTGPRDAVCLECQGCFVA